MLTAKGRFEMKDIIVIIILAVIVLLAAGYIYRAKKRGQTCIGCPHTGQCASAQKHSSCSGHCGSCGGCGSHADASADADGTE